MKHKKHNIQRMQINIDLRHHLLIYYNFNFNFVNVLYHLLLNENSLQII